MRASYVRAVRRARVRLRPLRLVSLPLLLASVAGRAAAQVPAMGRAAATAGGAVGGATVSGVVWDSLGRRPLAGAVVQLVGADSLAPVALTAASDSLGRYALIDVPDGHYTIGFLHPLPDSLGIQPPLRSVVVERHRPVRADLAIPAPARLRAAICGSPSGDGVVIGVVRGARDGAPLGGAAVVAEWTELTFTREGVVRRLPRIVATTAPNGWFALCNVPGGGTIALLASLGTDSTDRIELPVPEEGFLRRELSLGASRAVVAAPARLLAGDGRLSGTVLAADGGQPLAGAQVALADGPRTRADARGEWTLMDAPSGTRMLEVRAVGYYPERRPVDVVAGAAPVRVALTTMRAVLDTVRITATRLTDRRHTGFEERRRSGAGQYLTPEDIARRGGLTVSDVFRAVPGVRLEFDSTGMDRRIFMRGGSSGWCVPAFYVNGRYFAALTAAEVDTWVEPREIAGIEIYTDASVPAQFRQGATLPAQAPAGSLVEQQPVVAPSQQALSGCGSIVIWSR